MDEGAAMYTEEMCTLHAVFMLCFCTNFNDSAPSTEVLQTVSTQFIILGNRSMRIQDLYVGAFPLFIINASYARARAHTCPHTPTQGDLLVQAGRAL